MNKRFLAVALFSLAILFPVSLIQTGCGSSSNASGEANTASTSTGSNLSAKQLYRQALAKAVSIHGSKTSGKVEVDSDATKFNGQFTGTAGNQRVQGNMDVDMNVRGIPVSISADMIAIGTGKTNQEDLYMKFANISASGVHKQQLEAVFAPVLNKWVKTNDDKPDKPTTFENSGELATLDIVSWFLPLESLSDSDRNVFLSSIDRHDLYNVADGVENAQFQGVAARKIKVSIKKDVFAQVDMEIGAAISPASGYKTTDLTFIDEVFGKGGVVSADVYLSSDSQSIIGATVQLKLDKPVKDNSFNTSFNEVSGSMFVDYSQGLTISPPDNFISQAQMDALMSGSGAAA